MAMGSEGAGGPPGGPGGPDRPCCWRFAGIAIGRPLVTHRDSGPSAPGPTPVRLLSTPLRSDRVAGLTSSRGGERGRLATRCCIPPHSQIRFRSALTACGTRPDAGASLSSDPAPGRVCRDRGQASGGAPPSHTKGMMTARRLRMMLVTVIVFRPVGPGCSSQVLAAGF